MAQIRLQRYLAQCGVAARRKAEQFIVDGRVRVNGKVVDELGAKVEPTDRVTVDRKAVYPQDVFYVLLNKPKGFVTSVTDPEGRPTVMDLVPRTPSKVVPVGRLDFYTEGVLLLTNDGDLSSRLQQPRYKIRKTYHIKIRGELREHHLRMLRSGVKLDDGTITRPADIERLKHSSRHDWFAMTITEGKNRQVRRMFEALGYQVNKLQRVAFGGLGFHGVRVGDARELTQQEVNELRRSVNLATTTASRGTWTAKREDTDIARRARARERAEATEAAGEASVRPLVKRKRISQPGEQPRPKPKPKPKPRTKAGSKPSTRSGRPSKGSRKPPRRSRGRNPSKGR